MLKECNEKFHTLDRQIGEYQTMLGQLGEPANVADFEFERDRLKDEGEALKRIHCNYQKIKEDFLACQKQGNHRFDAFHAKFNEYLSVISGDSLTMDDDLLDMDPDRRLQAAALLKSFSEKNQIIFTTCDPSIAELLGGNQVKICT